MVVKDLKEQNWSLLKAVRPSAMQNDTKLNEVNKQSAPLQQRPGGRASPRTNTLLGALSCLSELKS